MIELCKKILQSLLAVALLSAQSFAVTISVWDHEKEEIQQLLDDTARKFEKENPGITVKRSHYKTEDLRTQYQTAALGGGGPEILIGPNDFAGPLSLMGIISPVNELVDSKLYFPDLVDGVKSPDGKIWGVPVSRGNHLMLFVNKSLVKKAPETIEEMVSEAKKATKGKVYGLAYHLNEPFWFVLFLSAYGDKPLKDHKANLNNQGMIDALTFVQDLKMKDKVVPPDCDYTCADTLFVEGKVGMTINGDWAVSKYVAALNKGKKQDLIIAPLPKSAKTGKYMQPMVSGKYIFFNSRAKKEQMEASKKFAAYLVRPDIQELFSKQGGRLPSLQSVSNSDVIKKDPSLAASQAALAHGQPMPMDVEMRAIWDGIRPQLQGVMAGRIKPTDAAVAMQKDAETKIKEMKQ